MTQICNYLALGSEVAKSPPFLTTAAPRVASSSHAASRGGAARFGFSGLAPLRISCSTNQVAKELFEVVEFGIHTYGASGFSGHFSLEEVRSM